MWQPLCPLCQSRETAERHPIRIPELGERAVAECMACGFFFVSPRPHPVELERFYSEDYFGSEHGGHGFADYFQKSHARTGEGWLIGRQLRRQKPYGRVLDLGCGAGDFLRGVERTSGWEAFGTDLSSYAIGIARRESAAGNSDLHLFCGELAAAQLPPEYFDAVFVRNVLEHVREPAGLLDEVWRILRPGGRLWLLVPNAHTELAPFAAANRRGQHGENSQAHLNFFTPVCFRGWLRRCGFEVESTYTLGLKRGLFALGYLPRAWKVSRRGRQALRSGSEPRKLPGWKHSLAYAYLRRWSKSCLKLPWWFPVGQELHAVARRPPRSPQPGNDP